MLIVQSKRQRYQRLGKKNDSWVLSSESSALSHIGAEFVREIDNGETIT